MRTVRVSFSVVMAALAGGFLGSIVFSGGGTHAASATTVLQIDVDNITP